MKCTILRNLGRTFCKKNGLDHEELTEGAEVSLDGEVAEKLIKLGLAETGDGKNKSKPKTTVKGEEPKASVADAKATPIGK